LTWRDSLPEELQSNPELDRIKAETPEEALGALAERVVGMRQSLGSAVQLPGKDASDEDMAAFEERMATLGFGPQDKAPENPEEYPDQFDATGIPPEVVDDFVEQARQRYARAGLGKKAAAKLLQDDANTLRNSLSGYHADVERVTDVVKQTYGPNAAAAIAAAERGAAAAGIDDLMNQPLMTMDGKMVSLGNRPEMIDVLKNIGERLGEDKTPTTASGAAAVNSAASTEDLQDERTLKMSEYAAMVRKNPGAPELVVKRREILGLSQRIAAGKTGDQELVGMTPKHIARYLATR
jgi:hypothetical protein